MSASAECTVEHGDGYVLESLDETGLTREVLAVVKDTTRETGAAAVDSPLTGHETYASTLSAARLAAAGSSALAAVDIAAVREPFVRARSDLAQLARFVESKGVEPTERVTRGGGQLSLEEAHSKPVLPGMLARLADTQATVWCSPKSGLTAPTLHGELRSNGCIATVVPAGSVCQCVWRFFFFACHDDCALQAS